MSQWKMQGGKGTNAWFRVEAWGGGQLACSPRHLLREFCQPLGSEKAAAGVDEGSDKQIHRIKIWKEFVMDWVWQDCSRKYITMHLASIIIISCLFFRRNLRPRPLYSKHPYIPNNIQFSPIQQFLWTLPLLVTLLSYFLPWRCHHHPCKRRSK